MQQPPAVAIISGLPVQIALGTGIGFLLMVTTPASAETYHWVDGSKTNHCANIPPPAGIKAENSWHSAPAAGQPLIPDVLRE